MVETVVHIDDLKLSPVSAGERFEHGGASIGEPLGLHGLGATLHVVPPGKTAWPYHRHHVSDEMFVILSGTGTYRIGDERLPVRAGDCLGAPAGGEAHQIVNTGNETLRYIAISNHSVAEVIEYPDSGHVAFAAQASDAFPEPTIDRHGRFTPAGYWDGEDTAADGREDRKRAGR